MVFPLLSFDILPQNSSVKYDNVRVAASLLQEDGGIIEWENINRKKLIQLVKKYHPVYLGTDNPHEVIGPQETLADFCIHLSSYTSLVHVNLMENGSTQPLSTVMRQNKIYADKKLNPVETARVLNQLMKKGVGMKLEPFEDETLIKIGRPKSHKKGGQSAARYERQNEEVVLTTSRKIKEKLDENKIEYGFEINKTKYGAKKAQFHIFTHKNTLSPLFRDISFYPAKVAFWSPKKRVITHTPIVGSRKEIKPYLKVKKLVMGLDPGMETGVAILSLDGAIVEVFSKKNLSRGELVDHVIKYGTPVLVCADVSPLPIFVKKIAAIYNAAIYEPSRLLSHDDKRNITKKYKDLKLNTHETDALSAAIFGINKYKDKFEKIDKSTLKNRTLKDYAKQLVINGNSVSESIHLSEEMNKQPVYKKQEIYPKYSSDSERIEELQSINHKLTEEITYYRAEQERQNNAIRELKNTVKKLQKRRDRKELIALEKQLKQELVHSKDKRIAELEETLSEYSKVISKHKSRILDLEEMVWLSMATGGYPIKILPVFSINAIDLLRRERGINDDDIILILNPTGAGPKAASKLLSYNLKMIFYENNNFSPNIENMFYRTTIPFIRAEKYAIRKLDTIAMISIANLELALQDYNENYERVKAEQKEKSIINTIENYQYERQKEIESIKPNYDDYEPDLSELKDTS